MERPSDHQPRNHPGKEARRSLALRLERAADALNPFLVLVVVGLILLDVTLYVGLSVSRETYAGSPPHQGAAAQTAAPAAPAQAAAPARR